MLNLPFALIGARSVSGSPIELQHLGRRRLHRRLRRQRAQRCRARVVDPASAGGRPVGARRHRPRLRHPLPAHHRVRHRGIIGFLPAALSTGIGSEIQKPLARVVVGGLISSTL
jgi:hypothetical protein